MKRGGETPEVNPTASNNGRRFPFLRWDVCSNIETLLHPRETSAHFTQEEKYNALRTGFAAELIWQHPATTRATVDSMCFAVVTSNKRTKNKLHRQKPVLQTAMTGGGGSVSENALSRHNTAIHPDGSTRYPNC